MDAQQRKRMQNRQAQRTYREKMKRKIEELEQWRNVALAVTSPHNGKIVASHQMRKSTAGDGRVCRKNRFLQTTDQDQQKEAREAIHSGLVRPPDDGLREIASVCNTEGLNEMDNLFPFDWSFRDDSAVSLCDYRTDSGTDRERKSPHDRSSIDSLERLSRNHSIEKSVNLAFEDGSTQAQDFTTSNFGGLEDALEVDDQPLIARNETGDIAGKTALHLAAQRGHIRILRLLQQHAHNPNVQDDEGRTALHHAVKNNHLETVRALLEQGATIPVDVNIQDRRGCSPLHDAVAVGNVVITRLLLQAPGIVLDQKDGNGETALHLAVWADREEIVQLLLEKGANVDIQIHVKR